MKVYGLIVIRILLALAGLALASFISKTIGIEAYGKYFEIQKIAQVIALCSTLGMPSLIIRDDNGVNSYFSALIIGVLLFILSSLIVISLTNFTIIETVAFTSFAMFILLSKFNEGFFVSKNRVLLSSFLSTPTVNILILITLVLFETIRLDILLIFYSSLCAIIFSILTFKSMNIDRLSLQKVKNNLFSYFVSGAKIFVSKLNVLLFNQSDTIFLLPIMSERELGIYGVVNRIWAFYPTITSAIRSYYTPELKKMVQLRDVGLDKFNKLYKGVTLKLVLLGLLKFALVLMAINFLLEIVFSVKNTFSLFDLALMGISNFLNMAFGLAGLRLILKNNEQGLFKATLSALVLYAVIATYWYYNVTFYIFFGLLIAYNLFLNLMKWVYDTKH